MMQGQSSQIWDDPETRNFSDEDDISSAILDYEDRKLLLRTIIDRMVKDAPSWDSNGATVHALSASTAQRFLSAIPANRELPKVAPDGEGDILFVWEPPQGDCIVTVQHNLLHLVDQPGTRFAAHIDGQQFAAFHIPISILHAIPFR